MIKDNYICYDIPKLSGYYGYDAQWIKIEKIWYFRHVLFDIYQLQNYSQMKRIFQLLMSLSNKIPSKKIECNCYESKNRLRRYNGRIRI